MSCTIGHTKVYGFHGAVTNVLNISTKLINDDYTLHASFKISQYRLTVTATNGGCMDIQTRSGKTSISWADRALYLPDYGAEVTITATPHGGWKFIGWSGTMRSTEATFTFTLTQDWALEANFEPEI